MSTTRTSAAAIRSLLRHAQDALEQQDWDGAGEYAARAIAANDKNANARLIAFMADRHVSSLEQLPAVARQMVGETPTALAPLADLLESQAAAGDTSHESTRALLAAHRGITAPVEQRLTTLELSREAFDRVFSDDDWQVALIYSPLEQRRAMERARSEADAVFADAVSDARAEVSQACAIADSRVPRVATLAQEVESACDKATADLARESGAEDTAVAETYSYLTGDIRTARAGLWVGVILIVIAAAMLAMTLLPSGAVTTNALASFPLVSVPVALVVLCVGIALLAARGNLVRSNRQGLRSRVEAKADAHGKAASRAERLDDEVASLRARLRSLETMRLDDDSFEDALEELSASIAVLGGAKAEPKAQDSDAEAAAEE